MATKADFIDWKQNPITKAVMEAFQNRITEIQNDLGGSAGLDPLLDRYRVGAIQAYSDILSVDFEDTGGTE